jgi:hypothetical protein
MSFKLRNTIILLALALIVIGFSVQRLVFHYPEQVEALTAEIEAIDQSVVQIPELEKNLAQAREIIREREAVLAGLDKTIETDISIADAFAYLDRIQDRYGALRFTLTYKNEREAKGFGSRSFQLTGEGTYRTVFALVWALERGPKIFVVERLNMRGVEGQAGDPDVIIPFDMTVRALYADVTGLPPINRTLSDVRVPWVRNLFYPLISKQLPPNSRGLVEVERAELRALLPGRALVADHTGKVRVLSEGDEVYLGYLTKIDQSRNLAEFTLNKGGIVERFQLRLQFSSEQGD